MRGLEDMNTLQWVFVCMLLGITTCPQINCGPPKRDDRGPENSLCDLEDSVCMEDDPSVSRPETYPLGGGDLLHFGAVWTYQAPESRDVESRTDVPSSPGFKAEIGQASESQVREALESPLSLSGQDRIKPHREHGTSLNEEDFQEPNRTNISEKIQSTMGKDPPTSQPVSSTFNSPYTRRFQKGLENHKK